MIKNLHLQNFRNYSKKNFKFGEGTTLIVGPNAAGKTNILEAIYTLATGRSFRAETEQQVVQVGQQVSRIVGEIGNETQDTGYKRQEKRQEDGNRELEIIWDGRARFSKLYRINGVGKRQVDFVGNFRAVLFCPQDIEIVADSPSTRRKYLDSVLNLVHRDYRVASHIYDRALRQRNRLLWQIRESSRFTVHGSQLEYWDNLLIENGKIIHEKRKEYLSFLGFEYDHSLISADRLKRYAQEEIAAATTLVGPQRDDFIIRIKGLQDKSQQSKDAKKFGSRGEQRLAIFAMKLKELEYVERVTGEKPTLLLDDIFSELDHENRHKLLQVIPKQQTIMTTTDLHLVEKEAIKNFELVNL